MAVTLTTPPRVHFAFNPWIIKISGTTYDNVSIGGDRREPYNGDVKFDIQRTIQALFDGVVEERLRALDYTSAIAGEGLALQTNEMEADSYIDEQEAVLNLGTYWAIWGAIGRGEIYGGDETIRWFYNYPFTVDFLSLADNSTITVTMDATGFTLRLSSAGAAALFNPRGYALETDNESEQGWHYFTTSEKVVITHPQHVYLKNQELEENHKRTVTLIPDCTPLDAANRVYIRWVDNLGRIRYHLFTETDTKDTVSVSSWNRAELPEPEVYEDNINDAQTTRQQFTVARTRTFGAACISKDEFETLSTVARSPIVDIFDGYDDDTGAALWHRVNVVAGSYSRDRVHLKDFSFSVTDKSQTTQGL